MEDNLIIYGKNAVTEAMKSNRTINALYILKGHKGLGDCIALAKKAGIVIKEATSQKLDSLSDGNRHGGVVAALAAVEYSTVEEIIGGDEKSSPFILMIDGVEDPHNLGALIRTAEAAGVNGVIIPKRRNVSVTGTVYAASAGAAAYVKIARVTNLVDTIKDLKAHNIWVYGAEADGEDYSQVDFGLEKGSGVCLIIGSEGFGLSRLVRENCDVVVSVPMHGEINSLNASVCGGILMFHIRKNVSGD